MTPDLVCYAGNVIPLVPLHGHCSISYWRACGVRRLQGQAFGAAAGVLGAAAAMRRQQMDRDGAQVTQRAYPSVCRAFDRLHAQMASILRLLTEAGACERTDWVACLTFFKPDSAQQPRRAVQGGKGSISNPGTPFGQEGVQANGKAGAEGASGSQVLTPDRPLAVHYAACYRIHAVVYQ